MLAVWPTAAKQQQWKHTYQVAKSTKLPVRGERRTDSSCRKTCAALYLQRICLGSQHIGVSAKLARIHFHLTATVSTCIAAQQAAAEQRLVWTVPSS